MRTSLYRQFSRNGVLLYVGVSLSPLRRIEQHSYLSPWFESVSSVTVEHFETKALALEAERYAIAFENPVHNVSKRKLLERKKIKIESSRRASSKNHSGKLTNMKKEPTFAQTIRLPESCWLKLRSLMTFHGGRVWLEKAVDREYKKAGLQDQNKSV